VKDRAVTGVTGNVRVLRVMRYVVIYYLNIHVGKQAVIGGTVVAMMKGLLHVNKSIMPMIAHLIIVIGMMGVAIQIQYHRHVQVILTNMPVKMLIVTGVMGNVRVPHV